MNKLPKVFLENHPAFSKGISDTHFWKGLETTGKKTDIRFFEDPKILKVEKEFLLFLNGEKQTSKIPLIIHFIWLGSKIPQKIQNLIDSWKNHHPDFTFMVWTDEIVQNHIFSSKRAKEVFIKAKTFAEKSDVLRYDILFQYGGVYSDTDVICLKPFTSILQSGVTFFAGLLTNVVIKKYPKPLFLGNAVIGAVKKSPLIKYCLENLYTEEEKPDLHLPIRTGPGLLSTACSKYLFSKDEKILIFPCSYFYPYPDLKRGMAPKEILGFIRKESYSLHLWNQSWNLPLEKNVVEPKRKNSPFYQSLNCTGIETDYSFYEDRAIEKIEKRFGEFLKGEKGESKIPKLIHFIWLGSELQTAQKKSITSFEKYHPDYKIKIWLDKDSDNYKWHSKKALELFSLASTYAEKSDILRYDILFQYGGVYSDTDVLCLKSFNCLLKTGTSFFAGLETNQLVKKYGHPLYIGNCIIGCEKGSNIMKVCLENLYRVNERPDLYLPMRTGPGLLSRACLSCLNSENPLILPCSYFYPWPHSKKEMGSGKAHSFIRKESYCLHLWDGSWEKKTQSS